MFIQGFDLDGANEFSLSIQGPHPASASGTVWIASPDLFLGWAAATRSIHRCLAGRLAWCYACDMYHDPDDADACPHEDGCPAKTEAAAACACPIPVIRVNGPGTGPSWIARVRFPVGGLCCCSGDLVAPFVKITHVDDNLQVTNATGTVAVSNVVSGVAGIRATGLSGTEPSTVKYDVIHRHYDESGAITNEVTTNATMKVWAVDILHEPVTTDTVGGFSVNPSGVVTGSNALFRIAIAPMNFPSSLVSWEASRADRVSFPSGTNGTEIVVHGDNAGDVTLTAHIKGYAGPSPICEAKVVPETVVPVHAFIICDASGNLARQPSDIQTLLSGANQIYSQVGSRFNLSSLSVITNQTWMNVPRSPSGGWPVFRNIVSYTNGTGGIELYFNRSIVGANGLTSPSGVLIANSGNPNTVAHELGHAQGLPDIYHSRNNGAIAVTGVVGRIRMPSDWGSSSAEGYYPPNLSQSNLIERLLMFGVGSSSKRDLPSGDIDGVWRPIYTTDPWQTTNAPSGFFIHSSTNPTSN